MSTPPGELNLSGVLEPPSPGPRVLRAPAPTRPQSRPAAPTDLNLSGVLEPPRSSLSAPAPRATPRSTAPPPAVDPRLDSFVNDVMGEASRRTGFTYKLGEGPRTAAQQAGKVAQGYSWTYNSAHMHGRGRDVLAFDAAGNYLKDGSHPAYKALGDVYGELAPKSPARVKWGVVRNGQQVDPGHFELDDDGDPATPALNLGGVVEPLSLDGILEPNIAADFRDAPAPGDDYGPPERMPESVAFRDDRMQAQLRGDLRQQTPPPLRRRQTFDPRTEEGRRGRDSRAQLERTPGAFLEVAVPLPSEERLSDVAAGGEMVRAAYVRALVERGVPESEAAKLVGSDYSLKNAKGEAVAPGDTFSDDNLDAAARTMRVRLDAAHISKLADSYRAGRGTLARAVDWATDDERGPGEKALEVAGAVAAPVMKGAGYVARPFQAASAGVWSAARGHNPLREAYDTFTTGETSAAGSNPIGNYLRDSETLNRINPRLGRLLGGGADLILDPVNLIGLGFIGKGAKALAGGGRVARAAEEVRAVGKALGLLERGIVDARPLGLLDEAGDAAKAIGADMELLTEEGGRLAHSSATGETVDLATGEAVNLGDDVASSAVRGEQLRYARERAAHYAREAEGAQSAGARRVARELADDYAAEAARLEAPTAPPPEGYDLTGVLEPHHHSHAQPRTAAGQFDGAPASLPRRAVGVVGDTADALKSNLYSADVSAPFRQALFPLMFETRATVKGLAEGLPSALPGRHARFVGRMRSLPAAQEANDMGLALSSLNPAAKSEYFPSAAASKLPWVGPSERVMEAQLDAVRLNVYERLTAELREAGLTPKSAPEEFRGVAHIVNVASGHGTPGRLMTPALPALNKVLGSPKLLRSRFQVLNPLEYARLPPRARRIALRKAGRTAAAFTGLFGLAYLAADEVGVDPREGNFGTARFGNTSYDLMGGEANKIRFIVNLVQSVGRTAKVVREGGSIKYEDTPVGVMTHFLRSQLSPAASLVPDYVTGKDYSGRDFTWSEAAARRVAPLMMQDIYDGYSAEGGKGAMKSLSAFLGVSVRQLDPEKVRRDWERATNRPAPVELSDVAGKELGRLGVDLKRLRADVVRPGFKVEGVDGEAVTPMSKDGGVVPPDVLARDLAEEISAAVEGAVTSPDYASFESDAARATYLAQIVKNTRARVYSGLRLKARENQLEELKRIGEYQRRLEGRSRQLKPGETMKLGEGEGGEGSTVNRLMNRGGDARGSALGEGGRGARLNLQGVLESVNVEDRRADGPFDPAVDEIRRVGPSPVTETQAADAALLIDSLDERRFLSFARNLADDGRLGVASEGAAAAFEYGARAAGSLGSRDASDAAGVVGVRRMLARERRLRPEQFTRDALAGRYGAAVRSEVEEDGILAPPPVRWVVPGRRARP